MALPLIGASIVGAIITGLTQFVANRAGMILVGLGLTFVGVKGFETFLGFVISDLRQVVQYVQSASSGAGSGAGLAAYMVRLLGYVGFFDGLNIIISGYMAFASLSGVAFAVRRLNK